MLPNVTKVDKSWVVSEEVTGKTIKGVEENVGVHLCDLGLGNYCITNPSKHKCIQKVD